MRIHAGERGAEQGAGAEAAPGDHRERLQRERHGHRPADAHRAKCREREDGTDGEAGHAFQERAERQRDGEDARGRRLAPLLAALPPDGGVEQQPAGDDGHGLRGQPQRARRLLREEGEQRRLGGQRDGRQRRGQRDKARRHWPRAPGGEQREQQREGQRLHRQQHQRLITALPRFPARAPAPSPVLAPGPRPP